MVNSCHVLKECTASVFSVTSSNLKLEAARSSKAVTLIYQTTQCYTSNTRRLTSWHSLPWEPQISIYHCNMFQSKGKESIFNHNTLLILNNLISCNLICRLLWLVILSLPLHIYITTRYHTLNYVPVRFVCFQSKIPKTTEDGQLIKQKGGFTLKITAVITINSKTKCFKLLSKYNKSV